VIDVKPMDKGYILSGCLHEGPIDTTAEPAPDADSGEPPHPWSDQTLERWLADNPGGCRTDAAFLREMIERYGTCALLAWEDRTVVGFLRFFPMTVARLMVPGEPEPILDPKLACEPHEDEGTLWVECVMACRPYTGTMANAPPEVRNLHYFGTVANVGARKGLGLRLAKALVPWAKEHGWKRIIKIAHPDLDVYYGQWGGGGRAFWEKVGFRVVGTVHRPQSWPDDLLTLLRAQAAEKGMSEDDVWTYPRMMREL
jgi:GNAT superfamily N-acetyltransferase